MKVPCHVPLAVVPATRFIGTVWVALLGYVTSNEAALTCEPSERKLEDIERLREYGFDDAAILKATEITAYYNAINRVVCALGVSLEAGLEAWEFGAQK